MNTNPLSLHLNTDQNLIAHEVPSQRVLEISLAAPTAAAQESRPPLNLALVLDRSGSMSGEKLEFVKQAAVHVLDLLQAQDHIALVAYDDKVNQLSSATPVTGAKRDELKQLIRQLHTGGSTNLSGGWLAGCQSVASAARENSLNRSLLLTDGIANVGETDLETLAHEAREIAKRGISTSTFGVGMGFNEHLLEAMSNQGGGNFYYIETPGEIPDIFQREFKELAAVTVRDIEINLEFPPNVYLKVLGGWATEFKAGHCHIDLGNLYSGQTLELYIQLLTPPASTDTPLTVQVYLKGRDEGNRILTVQGEMIFQYAGREKVASAPRRQEVMERFAHVNVAETANEALKLERRGEKEKANHLLGMAIQENRVYLPQEEVEKYQRLSERMRRGLEEPDRKQSQFDSYQTRRRRESKP